MAMKGPSPPQSFTLGAEKKKSRVREEKGGRGQLRGGVDTPELFGSVCPEPG